MALRSTTLAQHVLQHQPLSAPPEPLHSVLTKTIIQLAPNHPHFAQESAAEFEPAVRERLRRELDQLLQHGRPSRIAFNSSDDRLVQGSCFIEPHDAPDVQEQKLKRSRLSAYLDIIQQLTPAEFEALCTRLLEFFGVTSPHITRRTADDGIDFYGQVRGESVFFSDDLQPTIQQQLSIWLVGQAKQFIATNVGTPELRDFLGAVTLARSGISSTKISPVPSLDIRLCDPVFSMVVTGGSFSARAWTLISQSGIIAIDGELLSAFLADRSAGPGEEPELTAFRSWIQDGPPA